VRTDHPQFLPVDQKDHGKGRIHLLLGDPGDHGQQLVGLSDRRELLGEMDQPGQFALVLIEFLFAALTLLGLLTRRGVGLLQLPGALTQNLGQGASLKGRHQKAEAAEDGHGQDGGREKRQIPDGNRPKEPDEEPQDGGQAACGQPQPGLAVQA
jgi:hypothetical protein